MNKLEVLINRLRGDLGLNDRDLKVENGGAYQLKIEPESFLTLSMTPDGYSLYYPIASLPKNRSNESFFTEMLSGNLFGQGTGGAVLGLTADGEIYTLTQEIDDMVDYQHFRAILEDFLNVADFWRGKGSTYSSLEAPVEQMVPSSKLV